MLNFVDMASSIGMSWNYVMVEAMHVDFSMWLHLEE